MSSIEPERFRQEVLAFYRTSGRKFSWRETSDPYAIAVSEFMLQQTRTEGVEKKFLPFLNEFPDPRTLAEAPFSSVLQLWKGLGYNRRALYLQEFARKIVEEWEGKVPDDPAILIQFRGIGSYTAHAIPAFAYNRPYVFLETNIRRVFLHFYFPDKEQVKDKDIFPLIELTLDRENPREWYYALMDYGAYLTKAFPNPNRKSAHYTRQSSFEGSYRQLRGRILSILLEENRPQNAEKIAKRTTFLLPETLKALQELTREGLIAEAEGEYRIRQE
jgi:A/G-specific adenine glycosylase